MSALDNKKIEENALFRSDWLASDPYFYCTKTGVSGSNINDVIVQSDSKSINPEGLYNFLDFGYSVYGQTPISGVNFLPPASTLMKNNVDQLVVKTNDDPIEQWLDYRLSETDVIELIRERIQSWEANLPSNQEIVLPLSGGYDSRLLLWSLKDKSRVRAFTYGISNDQSRSTEVIRARELSKIFDIQWEQIEVSNFHRFLPNWNADFGLSTHAHGMYHYEFYEKIRTRLQGKKCALLSGIIGDIWAGSITYQNMESPLDLTKLGYTHALIGNADKLNIKLDHNTRDEFWNANRTKLQDLRFQTITSMRLKLIMLCYLLKVPSSFGFQAWSPFLDIDIAMAMLNLPAERRRNRSWQNSFFTKVGLNLETYGLKGSRQNLMDLQVQKNHPAPKLDLEILSNFFDPDYLKWINKEILVTRINETKAYILAVPKFGGMMRKLGFRNKHNEAYAAYLCLRPIQEFLRQRDLK